MLNLSVSEQMIYFRSEVGSRSLGFNHNIIRAAKYATFAVVSHCVILWFYVVETSFCV